MREHSGAPPSGLIEGIKENAKLAVISGVVLILAGTFAVLSPLVVGLSITVMVGVSLLIGGVDQCFLALKAGALGDLFMALQLRPAEGWGLMLFNGIVTLLLGMMLWRQFPLSGAWAIGVLFGIKMIFSGRNVKQAATSFES